MQLRHPDPEQGAVVATWCAGTREAEHAAGDADFDVIVDRSDLVVLAKLFAVLRSRSLGHLVPDPLGDIGPLTAGTEDGDDFLVTEVTDDAALDDMATDRGQQHFKVKHSRLLRQ